MKVSAKTQQRLIHRHQFEEITCSKEVAEISIDGGKVRLRTTNKGESLTGGQVLKHRCAYLNDTLGF